MIFFLFLGCCYFLSLSSVIAWWKLLYLFKALDFWSLFQVFVYVCAYAEHSFLRQFCIYSHSLAGKPADFAVGTLRDSDLFLENYQVS